ncbi:hypothetical protein C2S51_010245 [Perilla frutescens var. frutescens]|nr:hypothetical protein C2S51_010245 [Perilla frutescens var. frutescens]
MTEALDAMDFVISPDMNSMLGKHFTREELATALSQMHPSKAPGPDVMSVIFYKKLWPIL